MARPPKRPHRTQKTSAFPLLPMAAATLVLLGVAQVSLWWWQSRLPTVPGTEAARQNPFSVLPEALKRLGEAPMHEDTKGRVKGVQRLQAPVLPQNLQFGDALGTVTVTIFTDPSCGPCREQIRNVIESLPVQGVKLVYKFWPEDPGRLTPGLLVELARRRGLVGTMWRSIEGTGADNLDDGRLLSMLDDAGLKLGDQRKALREDAQSLGTMLEPDIALAKGAKLSPPPVFLLDDYVLDGKLLNPAYLGDYVKKRLEGRQVFERNDLFLMHK